MERQKILDSNNVASIGYDNGTKTLEIEFSNGSIYQYFDIPKNLFEGLIAATSKGEFFAVNIKGFFRFSRI